MTDPKRIAITGATGSLGSKLIEHLLAHETVERLVGISRDEWKQARILERHPDPRLRMFLGDVRDRDRLVRAFYGIDTVIHAAALKRVDAISYDPSEAFQTNVVGTVNVVDAAILAGVRRVLFTSSDKACLPTTPYGKTKAMAEDYALAANAYGYPRGTTISAVRYGNVFGSRGSVIHAWRRQIRAGKPATLTVPRMTRFWLTLSMAVDVVSAAVGSMRGGEIFIPHLSGATMEMVLGAVILSEGHALGYPVEIIGFRPGGEKLHETLIAAEELYRVRDWSWGESFIINPSPHPWRVDPPWTQPSDLVVPYTSQLVCDVHPLKFDLLLEMVKNAEEE